MGLAGGAAMPQVRAIAGRHLARRSGPLPRACRQGGDGETAAHFILLARDIQRFEDRPFDVMDAGLRSSSPSGGADRISFALEWIGDWSDPAGSLLRPGGACSSGPALRGPGG